MPQRIRTNADIYHNFISSHCRCSAKKWEHSAFCAGCYGDLSKQTKKLLKSKFGRGFETAYRKALAELEGTSVRRCSECGVDYEWEAHRAYCIWAETFDI